MRLPGTRYQEHGWEHVRKLLGHCSLLAFASCTPAQLLAAPQASLAMYVDLMADALHAAGAAQRGALPGNSYGDSVAELAMSLVFELRARPADWAALCSAVAGEHARIGAFWEGPAADAILRKKVNDMYAVLRDKVDSDNYQAACGRPCSPNKMYAYRMLDTAYGEVARLFARWQQHPEQVAAILGRASGAAQPIETRQMRGVGQCKSEWIVRWSASLEQFGGGPGPLHTRSKRFANLKTSAEKIGAMLREIGDYEELSSNRDQDWLHDAGAASAWLEDLWRVAATPCGAGPDQILAPPADDLFDAGEQGEEAEGEGEAQEEAQAGEEASAMPRFDPAIAASLSLPPSYLELAWLAQDRGSRLAQLLGTCSLPVRLAVYLNLLGAHDDSYPVDWLDPATGELPTMQQLAALDQVSLPTLRKRRDGAIAALLAAPPPVPGRTNE